MTERPSMVARVIYRALWWLAHPVGRLLFRLEVTGRDRVPTSGGCVLAPVHRSNLDFLLAAAACPRRVRWMAKDSIFKGGWIDRLLYGFGAFPVHRDLGADRAALRATEELLRNGEVVVLFPEGRRKEGPVVEEVFDGPAFVASRQRVPIVPLGIGGSASAMPIGKKMIRPRKVTLHLAEPIYPDVPLEGRVPRSSVQATSRQLREAVQRIFDQAQRAAGH